MSNREQNSLTVSYQFWTSRTAFFFLNTDQEVFSITLLQFCMHLEAVPISKILIDIGRKDFMIVENLINREYIFVIHK